MKKGKVFIVTLALLALVAGTAQAEMYVEGYVGGNFAGNASSPLATAVGIPGVSFTPGEVKGNIDPAFLGGIKIGTWFVREGTLGMNYPEWMKYLGFYLDFQYHAVNFANRADSGTTNFFGPGTPVNYFFKSEGAALTLAFMFAFRYGFLPDKEVPFGRLQPYVAVGPALMVSWQQPTIGIDTVNGIPVSAIFGGTPYTWNPDSAHSTNLALQVEAGIRWMCLKNVSMDVSFKYRYAHPIYDYTFFDFFAFSQQKVQYSAAYNFFSVNVGAAYHF